MRPTFLALIAVLAMLAFCNTSNAAPLTFYTNQAAWDAAVSGLSIGPYTGNVFIADTTTTINAQGYPPCAGGEWCIAGVTTTTETQVGFSSIAESLNSFNNDCGVCSSITDTTVYFGGTPILGLAATGGGCFPDTLEINGIAVPYEGSCVGQTFFGLVGPIYSLDFNAGCNELAGFAVGCTDDFNGLDLEDIVVATVPEPSTLGIALMGLDLIGGALHFGRKKIAAAKA